MNTILTPWRILSAIAAFALGANAVGATFAARTGQMPGLGTRPAFTLERQSGHTRALLLRSFGNLPLRFEVNQGQLDGRVRFLARGAGYMLALTGSGAVLALSRSQPSRPTPSHGGALMPAVAAPDRLSAPRFAASGQPRTQTLAPPVVLRLHLAGANAHPRVIGLDRLPGLSNYFIGNDPRAWRNNAPGYARVAYRDVYPGVDQVYYGHQGQLEYDLIVAPGASPRIIRLALDGAGALRLDRRGNLVLGSGGQAIRQERPVVYQQIGDVRRPIAGHYVLLGHGQAGFAVGAYDTHKPLVIDPVLTYSTYLGGNKDDDATGIAVDAAGNAYITGQTNSMNFPTMNALHVTCGDVSGCGDAFVAKLNASGSALVYSTYLGGSGLDLGISIAVDSAGNAYVTGQTTSANFPTVNALQPTCGDASGCGPGDAFVTKLSQTGSALIYSTYLGGNGSDSGSGIAVDPAGNVYITGQSRSANFPTVHALQPMCGDAGGCGYPGGDAFVAKLDWSGRALVYSTYLGGSGIDWGNSIAFDSSGNAYITGLTSSSNFPVFNALQSAVGDGACLNTFAYQASGRCDHAFVAKLNPSGSALVYSTYLGGSGDDVGNGIAVDSAGNAYVTGSTTSTNFPTANALQAAYGGGGLCRSTPLGPAHCSDAFVAKLNPSGSALVYSTYLGGSGIDEGEGIAVDSTGHAYVTGLTSLANFPTANALQHAYSGGTCGAAKTQVGPGPCTDAFVAKLNPSGRGLAYSTYLGGTAEDGGYSIALDSSDNAYLVGYTSSANFPTAHALQGVNGGGQDAFMVEIRDPQSATPSLLVFIIPGGATAVAVAGLLFFVLARRRRSALAPASATPQTVQAPSSVGPQAGSVPPSTGPQTAQVPLSAETFSASAPRAAPARAGVPACGQCGRELIHGKTFCPRCGAPVPLSCPRCGESIVPGEPFCPTCGYRVQEPEKGASQ